MSTTENDDDRLRDYLSGRAGTITLPPGDSSRIMARVTRRRHRRRTMTAVAAVAAVATGGAVLATQRPGGNPVEVVGAAAPGVVDSALEWTVVEPDTGLGFTRSTVRAGDGPLYSLSTAPGPTEFDDPSPDMRSRLYRSDDGAEWDEVALPDDLWASALAIDGDRLYALGTAPAGGGRQVVLRSTSNEGGPWSDAVALPLELDGLEERFAGQLMVETTLATGPAGVIAAVIVRASPDLQAVVPGLESSGDAYVTATGVDVMALPPGCEPADDGGLMCEATELPSPSSPLGSELDFRSDVIASYTWDELGVDTELQEYIGGRLFTFLSSDGAAFEPVDMPVPEGDIGNARLLVGDGVYRMFVTTDDPATDDPATDEDATSALRSADGRTWEVDSEFQPTTGYAWATGLLAGRPAVVVGRHNGEFVLQTAQVDGTWSMSEPLAQLRDPRDIGFLAQNVTVGPLGLVVVVVSAKDPSRPEGPQQMSVVHSTDGADISVTPVDEFLESDDRLTAIGIDVSADAVTVRFDEADDDPATAPRQRLLVGTPSS